MATVTTGTARVEKVVVVGQRPTLSVNDLTYGEWQVIRNALFGFADSKEFSADQPIDGTDETQRQAAERLMETVFTYKGRSNMPASK